LRFGATPWSLSGDGKRVTLTLAGFVTLAVLLDLFAGTGLAYVAGLSQMRHVVVHVRPEWLLPMGGALAVSFAGYYCAYHGIFTVGGCQVLTRRQLRAMAAAGFSGLLAHIGGKLDQHALMAAGMDESSARVRVMALAGLEQGVLAIGGCAMSAVVLATGMDIPPDFTVPWVAVAPPCFLIAFWAAWRYRDRFRGRPGWRGALGTGFEAVYLIRELFARPLRWGWAWLGMAVFWAADACAVWAGLAAFGYRMNGAALFVGFATGMVFTRRTSPLAGAGFLTVVLPLTLWNCGAPLPVAVAGVFASRLLAIWLPLPASMAALPILRSIGPAGGVQASRPGRAGAAGLIGAQFVRFIVGA
jgi:hypothetical protein